MRFAWLSKAISVTVLAALLAGCGGSSGPGSDPVSTVKGLLDTMTAGNFDKIPDYACAAQKDKVAKQFDPSSMFGSGGAAMGISAADIKSMLKITVSGLDLKEKSKDATKAVVTVAGKMKMEINKDKFKEVMKKALEAAGQPADDATLTLAMGMVDSLGQEQDMASDMDLVNEGGKWLVCPSS